MNIGIVGSGKIGGVVGKLWARAGHTVRFVSLPLSYTCTLSYVDNEAKAGSFSVHIFSLLTPLLTSA